MTERFDTLREHGARYVRAVLKHCDGNKRQACHILKITYHTLRAYERLQLPEAMSMGATTLLGTYPRVYRHLVRAASHERPEGHANALREYVKLARTVVPAHGIFDPGSRDEDVCYSRIQEVGERWFGVTAAHQQLQRLMTTAMANAENGADATDAVQVALADFQKRSHTAYFYAGLAFGLVFVEYGTQLSATPRLTADSDRRLQREVHTDIPGRASPADVGATWRRSAMPLALAHVRRVVRRFQGRSD